MKRTGPTNIYLIRLIRWLRKQYRKHGAPIWLRVAELLDKPRRQRIVVNVSKINRYTKPGALVVIPGKVLGAGKIDHPVTVAALSFSASARQKIEEAKGRCISIKELVELNPKGSNVQIIV